CHWRAPLCDEPVRTPTRLRHTIHVVSWRFVKGGVVGVFILAASALRVDAAAPESELWERWAAHSPSAVATIDHGEWDAFLAKNLVSSPDDISRIA
ncbi:MAG: hypothetical protein QNL90_10385, partial [Gammaproteobacteria bacterium]|nr:hypothetical protein [Gammaproteobacteria bacterium]MDX2460511.1 hypothetical protein [Gammaproteobacteria bacterium]